MLPVRNEGAEGPLLIMLHWLGGGAQTWMEVSRGLAVRGVRCAAIDLPGFGYASRTAGFSVTAMADQAVETIRFLRRRAGERDEAPWLIAGHSMGGKIAAVVARKALNGEPGLRSLRGVVLVSPSPPGPEPMSNAKRAEMLASLGEETGDPARDRNYAAKFVDDNTGTLALPDAVRERAIHGVLGMNRTAFRHWLEYGSKEDWQTRVGELKLPALVFAGTEDEALGPKAQREHTLPHLPQGELITLEAAGHLAPLERPGELVERLTQFIAGLGLPLFTPERTSGRIFEQLLDSDHVSPGTREVMEERLAGSQNWNHQPIAFSADEFRTLRAVVARVVPDAGFDMAAHLDRQIGAGLGDGWRYAALPPDRQAWQRGLMSLDLAAERRFGVPFVALFAHQQDELLHAAGKNELSPGLPGKLHVGDAAQALSAEGMKVWFSDVRAECTRLYVGDPRTMERIGYTGFADDLGFTQITIGAAEEFER